MEEVKAYHDFFVKFLFLSEGNEDILMDFINKVFIDSGFKKIKSVTVKHPFNLKDFPSDKESIIDIRAKDEAGRQIQVEIQVQGGESHKHRILYYWAKAYSDQLRESNK